MAAGNSDNVEADQQLLVHIAEEFGDHGARAVEFLQTAETLVEGHHSAPRLQEAACYCVREALKGIPMAAATPKREPWQAISRAVADARNRYRIASTLPGLDLDAALRELLQAIDELELVHSQERIHRQRLLAVMTTRTGTSPMPLGPIEAYQNLIDRLDRSLHSNTTIEQARAAYAEGLGLLRQLFMPPHVRLPGLAALAGLDSPNEVDARRLVTLVASPTHLNYFFSYALSPDWLELLDRSGLLTPPEGQGNWPVLRLIERVKDKAPKPLADWLIKAYDRWGKTSPARAWFIGCAALDLGMDGHSIVLAALRDNPGNANINQLAVSLLERLDPESSLVVDIADLALNASSGLDRSHGQQAVSETLHRGVTFSNWKERVDLLLHKLAAIDADDRALRRLDYEQSGSIADPMDLYGDERLAVLLAALIEVLRASRSAGISGTDLLLSIDRLRGELRPRVRAWLLGQLDDVPLSLVIEEIAEAIAHRGPSGDDVPLVDLVRGTGAGTDYIDKWIQALGTPPSPGAVGNRLAEGTLEKSWIRARRWSGLLPDPVTKAWSKVNAIFAGAFGPVSRDSLTTRRKVQIEHGSSPIAQDQLAMMSVPDAARWVAGWRPDPNAWLVSARELARTLEAVVNKDRDRWTEEPVETVSLLREPIYISHYFRGLAHAESPLATPAEDLVEAVAFARTHPWAPVELGNDTFDYDSNWNSADDDGVALLKHLSDKDIGFGDRADQAWDIVLAAARHGSVPDDELYTSDDSLAAAINRSQTRAVEAVFALMGWEYRGTKAVRPDAFVLLDAALHLDGVDGEQHRAIIAPRLPFLLFVAQEWVEERANLFFGDGAPGQLAQVTVDLYVKWGRPNSWVYKQTRVQALDAVGRGVDGAMSFYLVGVLWRVDGYGVRQVVNEIAPMGDEQLSAAGKALVMLLRDEAADRDHISVAADFFKAVLALRRPASVYGFGWFAEIKQLDDSTWLDLTAQAAQLSAGRLDWGHKVADRAAASKSPAALGILNELVRGLPDEWDRGRVMEKALTALRAAPELRDTETFRRLRTSLLERGMFGAQDL